MRRQYASALALLTAMTVAGLALTQPPPTRPPAAAPPGTAPPATPPPVNPTPPPTPPPATPPKDAGVPNTAAYPDVIGGRKLEEWIKDIDSPDPSIREEAIKVVVQFGPPARRAIPALVKQVRLLNDLSPQASAIIALSELVPLAPVPPPGSPPDGYTKDAVDALIQSLDSTQAIIRYRAAAALVWIGPPAHPAIVKLIARIDDRYSWEIRKAVCAALGTVGRDEYGWPIPNALEALGKGVSDRESRNVRIEALQSIIALGPLYGGGAPPQLVGVLKQRRTTERDKMAAIWVHVALMRLAPAELTDANLAAISKQLLPKPGVGQEVRVQAAKALGYMGPAAKPAMSDMIDALQSSTENLLTVQLCWSLARMGQYAERALPALNSVQVAHKGDKDDWVRSSAKVAAETIEKAILQNKPPPPPMPTAKPPGKP